MSTAAKIVFYLNSLIFIGHWIFVFVFFIDLPQIIPTHFGISGVADGFSNKKSIFLLPIISTGIYFLMNYMSNNPYAPGLNIPDEMRENPVLTKLFVQLMSLVCMIIFADISWEAIRIATNKQTDLSMFLPIALGLLFVMMFVFFYIAKKMKPQS